MPKTPVHLPSPKILRSIFEYNRATGYLTNKVSRTTRRAGARAESLDKKSGYLRVYVGKLLYAHRVAWSIYYGYEPKEFIDHINGDKTDNRISNLRISSHPQNMCNRLAPAHNTSGIKGVSQRKDNGHWRAYVTLEGKRENIGTFKSRGAAAKAATLARKKMHGKFAK